MLRKLLFETRAGERLLALLEKHAGLALVEAEWLDGLCWRQAAGETPEGQGIVG